MQQRPNGIPESWNIEATKNNFVLNTSNIKDINKIENDIKNAEINKIISFKSKYVPESWNLYATTNIQTSNISQIDENQQQHKNKKHKNYSSTHENMTKILHHNRARNIQQQRQLQLQQDNEARARAEKYFNDNRPQFVELHKTNQNKSNQNKSTALFKSNKNKVNIFDRLNQRKQEPIKQPFIE